MKNEKLMFKVLNAFALVATVAVNAIAQILPLGGYNTGEISAMYPTLLTPAPITFAIWGIIYLLLAGVVVQQFVTSRDDATTKVGWMFAITCALNIGWMIFWHFQIQLLATLAIVGLWIFLMMISKAVADEHWLVKATFNIYYGWITVATAAQVYIFLVEKFPGLGEGKVAVIITIGAMAILTVFGLARVLAKQDSFFGLAIAWAITGIFIKHVSVGFSNANPGIVFVSGICAALMLATVIYMCMHTRKLDEHRKLSDSFSAPAQNMSTAEPDAK